MTNDEQRFGGVVGRTVRESTPWWPAPVRPPARSPNVVVVLLDDMGFSDIGPYGAEIATPTLDRLAADGIRFTNYHTTPLCSPSRAALQTGLNPHRAGFAGVANFDPGFPGWTMEIDPSVETLPEALRAAGYATFAVGKWHLTRDSAMHGAAPRDSWPLQRGFERYYGVLEGWTNLHQPHALVRDNSPVDVDEYPEGYYFTDDITDQAIRYLKELRAHDADRPFFLYLAHGAVHGPLHAKASDLARHRGRYDTGWDTVREARFARQKELGLFPDATPLPPRNHEAGHEVRAWSEHTDEERALFARYMEVYAAMVDNVDQNLARLLDVVDALGDLENTVVIFTSDNGGTEEGGATGSRSYFKKFGGFTGMTGWNLDVERDPELIGGPQMLVHYPRVGDGLEHALPALQVLDPRRRRAGPADRVVAGRDPRARPGHAPSPVPVRDRPVPHDPRPGRAPGPRGPGRLQLRNRHLARRLREHPSRAVLGVLREPELLSGRVEAGGPPPARRPLRRRRVGAVRHHVRPDRDGRPAPGSAPTRCASSPTAWESAASDNQVFPLDDGTGLLQLLRRPDDEAFHREVRLLPGTPTLERYRSQQLIAFRDFTIDVVARPRERRRRSPRRPWRPGWRVLDLRRAG